MQFKRYTIFLLLALLLSSLPTLGRGVINQGISDPDNLVVYYSSNWSNLGLWDLSKEENLKDKVIREINLSWRDSSSLNQSYKGLHIWLHNQEGKGILLSEGIIRGRVSTEFFKGERAQQRWQAKYYVDKLKSEGDYFSISPRISIYYKAREDEE